MAFRNEIGLHEKSIDVVGAYAEKYDKKAFKKFTDVVKKAKRKRTRLTDSDMKILKDILRMHPEQEFLFAKNTIVSIVSMLDDVFCSIFREYYTKNIDKLPLEDRSISYGELDHISKIGDAKKYLVDREIETILIKEGLKSRFDILEKEMDVSLPNNEDHLFELNKLIKTRNLIVHNSSRADKEYVRKYGIKKMKEGDNIPICKHYLKDSLSLIFYVGSYLLQATQINQTKEKLTTRDFVLNDVMHELVKKEKYTFLKELYNTANSIGLDDMNRKMMIINFCVGLKKQGKSKSHIEKVLIKEDWSVEDPNIALCLAALRDEDEEFYSRLRRLIKNGNLSDEDLVDWEVFSFYRKKTKFREIVKRVIK